MSDDIVLDEPAEKKQPATKKPKQTTPVWAVLVVVLTFFFGLVGSMTIQLLERNYYRGGSPSEADPYAAQVVIPPIP